MQTNFLRSKWVLPLSSVFLGGCMLLASWLGGDPRNGVWMFCVMAAVGLIFLVSGRSETMRLMRGDQKDERWTLIDLRATAIAGHVVIGYTIGGFMYELAHGRDGSPYGLMGAAAGLAYLVTLVGLRLRG